MEMVHVHQHEKCCACGAVSALRCGVLKPNKNPLEPSDVCYCPQERGLGVQAGFWHKMEVLSLPYTPDLFWPNTSAFQVLKSSLHSGV
jgi:hypothetical protein